MVGGFMMWRHDDLIEHQTPCGPMQDRDEAVQRVLLVDLLNLLAADGAYGERMCSLLDASGALSWPY